MPLGQFFVRSALGLLGEPLAETFEPLVHEHAFARDDLAALRLCHLQKPGAWRRIYDVAHDLPLVEAFRGERAFVFVRGHAHGSRVDDDVEIGGDAFEVGEGRNLYPDLDKYRIQAVGERLALFCRAAHDGERVALFHERERDCLCGAAVPEERHALVADVHAVFFEVADAAVRVGSRPAESAPDNSVFPVERVHAAGELADVGQLVHEFRIPVATDEFRLVGDGDVCAAELHRPEPADGVREIFRFRCVGEVACVYSERLEKGVVHRGRLAVRYGMPENTERFCFAVYTGR